MDRQVRNGHVFLDEYNCPFWIKFAEKEIWLFQFGFGVGDWVFQKKLTPSEIRKYPKNLTTKQQDAYHKLAGSNPYIEKIKIKYIEFNDGNLKVIHECGETIFEGEVFILSEVGFDGVSTIRFGFVPKTRFAKTEERNG